VNFKLLASEIDEDSFGIAEHNVIKNGCDDRVAVCEADGMSEGKCDDEDEGEEEDDETELISETILTQGMEEDEM
jgi:predicted O-methyltransferase YrrM